MDTAKALVEDAIWAAGEQAKGTGFDDSQFEPPLDKGIRRAVVILNAAGIETYESCEGGDGHSYAEPTIRFHGEFEAGFRALSVAMVYALPVRAIHRAWQIIDGEPTGPTWEMVFWEKLDE